MKKIVRVAKIEEQDEIRREDIRSMTPSARMEALLKLRDRLYPYAPLERVIAVRQLR